MQNQSSLMCKIVYSPIDLPDTFPVSCPGLETQSPSIDQITFMHYHNNIELGYCYKGCGIFFINGRIIPFSEGDACIIFPNEIHIAQSDKSDPSEWKFINIDPMKLLSHISVEDLNTLLALLKQNSPPINIIPAGHESNISKIILELFNELGQLQINYKSMVKSLLWSILLKLLRCERGIDTLPSAKIGAEHLSPCPSLMKIAPALKYISENYMYPIQLSDISSRCNLSESHFRRLFTSAMNMPPLEYLYTVRIKMASILLTNLDEPILEISMKVGYATLSSFNRHFKRIMGISPKEWKKVT